MGEVCKSDWNCYKTFYKLYQQIIFGKKGLVVVQRSRVTFFGICVVLRCFDIEITLKGKV